MTPIGEGPPRRTGKRTGRPRCSVTSATISAGRCGPCAEKTRTAAGREPPRDDGGIDRPRVVALGMVGIPSRATQVGHYQSVRVDTNLTRKLRYFVRRRNPGGFPPPVDDGYGLRLKLTQPLRGLLMLGYALSFIHNFCHLCWPKICQAWAKSAIRRRPIYIGNGPGGASPARLL